MQGAVNWPQLIFISGVIVMVAGFMFLFAWRTQELRSKDRHDQRTAFQQEIVSVHELVGMVQKDLDARLRTIEMSNAGTLVMLKHMEDFKREVLERFEALDTNRAKDTELLNRRLDDMHNAARLLSAADRVQR